jgi:hypothetical protein
MNPFTLFTSPAPFTGALEDPRTPEEKAKDFRFDEIVATAAPVRWEQKEPSQWKQYPIRSQGQAGSCVAHSGALLAGIVQQHRDGQYIDFSASDIYQKRKNRPDAGMWGVDAFSIMQKDGLTLEALMPSMNMTEAEIHLVPRKSYYGKVGEIFQLGEYVQYTPGDMHSVASTIQKTGKGVMVWFRFHYNEWTATPSIRQATPPLHHSVVAIDTAVYQGKRGIIVQDSWGLSTGIQGRRFISEDFYRQRNTFAAYTLAFRNDPNELPTPPRRTFTRDLQYGMVNDPDVKRMQDILKFEEVFPTNIESTGNYFEVTRRAVLAYQRKYKVDTPAALTALDGRLAGPKTRSRLSS